MNRDSRIAMLRELAQIPDPLNDGKPLADVALLAPDRGQLLTVQSDVVLALLRMLYQHVIVGDDTIRAGIAAAGYVVDDVVAQHHGNAAGGTEIVPPDLDQQLPPARSIHGGDAIVTPAVDIQNVETYVDQPAVAGLPAIYAGHVTDLAVSLSRQIKRGSITVRLRTRSGEWSIVLDAENTDFDETFALDTPLFLPKSTREAKSALEYVLKPSPDLRPRGIDVSLFAGLQRTIN